MNIFDIMGPVMVGPSSSHTAGAVRIGLITRKLLGEEPKSALIDLHGSFAATGVGHGTDKALIAGLLGMQPDDMRIPRSDVFAKELGVDIQFDKKNVRNAHPNTAVLHVEGKSGRKLCVQASSIGGGRIEINKIDDTEMNVTGEKPTLVIQNQDITGLVAKVAATLSDENVNIATMQLCRDKRGGVAVMVIETDQGVQDHCIQTLKGIDGIKEVTYITA
ncbi:MAG: L-serine ammonia-lyase, iron-sulfur-dependent, subunit beta [Lachnospiraceae bacterium]|nr:L-serine ammonia-lyase, iron-sulfur-dependent, subunit beta [Lachnospiraceae bacterium]